MTIDLDDGLVLYLPFNDGSGTSARDDSGKLNTGTLQNMDDSDWVSGKSGDALDFNGTDEYVSCGNHTSLDTPDAISIAAWIKPDNVTNWCTIAGKLKTDQANSAVYLVVYANEITFVLHDTVQTMHTLEGGTIAEETWYHVVGTYDGTTMKLYVDNVLVDSLTETFTINTVTHDLWIGANEWWGEYFEGLIDEFRMYNRAINQVERTWLCNHPSGTMEHMPSARACITDLDGTGHTISDMISTSIDSEITDAADSFSLELSNIADRYSWLERGCEIEILIGMGGVNTKKLTGIVLDVSKYLDGDDYPYMDVSGEDWGYKINNLYFSDRFYDTELSAVVKAILDSTDYTSGDTWREIAGISSDYTNIDATAYTTDVASFKWQSIGSAIKTLADAAGFDWYIDINKALWFFDSESVAITATLTDSDLVAPPSLSDVGDIVNRAIVVGGYEQKEDQSGSTKTTTTTITSSVANNEMFTPDQDYLSSILVWTELVTGSSSDIKMSIQADSGSAPDGVNMSNGQITIKLDAITDGGYTEFRFKNHVTLTPNDDYWIVLEGTDADGQKVGVDGSANLDFYTRWPSRIVIMADDDVSQGSYGMCMCQPHVDNKIEDPDIAEQMANETLVLNSKKVADITRHGTDIDAGDVVNLILTAPGVAINKTMKVVSSSWDVGEKFIDNDLHLEEI